MAKKAKKPGPRKGSPSNNPAGRPPTVGAVERLNVWLGQDESAAVTEEQKAAQVKRTEAARRLIRKGAGLPAERDGE